MVNYQTLVGRQWNYGLGADCYSLVRDYYKLLGVVLPDYERPENIDNLKTIFLDELPKIGFKPVPFKRRRVNDILLMRLGSRIPQHVAILLSNERILYQCEGSLSSIEQYRLYYVKRTEVVFRYEAKGLTPR